MTLMPSGGEGGVPIRWVTKILQPPSVMNPIRAIPVVFCSNWTASVPLPLPDAAFGNVIHDTVEVALHVQPVGVVTLIV